MSNWEKFKKKDSPSGDEPEGKMIPINATCQTCNEWVIEGKFFPTDRVLSYKCREGHLSLVEKYYFM